MILGYTVEARAGFNPSSDSDVPIVLVGGLSTLGSTAALLLPVISPLPRLPRSGPVPSASAPGGRSGGYGGGGDLGGGGGGGGLGDCGGGSGSCS